MQKDDFIISINNLVQKYKDSKEYRPPRIKKQWISWHFVGWWALSLGLHFSLKHLNFEIHLPFGFIKISLKKEHITYYDVLIQI
uniref:Uncharacterized protein n=1 Tax=viral metagenome TaxID=1070528 RepID=A0A6M3KS04_9ZZZZ